MGIPFTLAGVSEPNPDFQKVLTANFDPQHLHETIRDQVDGCACTLHPLAEGCSVADPPCDLVCLGTPCPPYSDQRTTRYCAAGVDSHPLASITTEDARDMICLQNHKAIIMEQVSGFDKADQAGKPDSTPMRRQA